MRNALHLALMIVLILCAPRSGPQAQQQSPSPTPNRYLGTFEVTQEKVAGAVVRVMSWTITRGGHTALGVATGTGNYIRDHIGGSRSITRLMGDQEPSGNAGAIRSKSVTRRFVQSLVVDFDWQRDTVLRSQKGPPRVLAMTGLDDGTISSPGWQ